MKKILFGILLIFNSTLFAQERLSDLINNSSLFQTVEIQNFRSSSLFYSPYFIVDTVSIPFIDDFSTNKLFVDYPGAYPPSFKKDSLAYNFSIAGLVLDSIKGMADTSWTYTFNSSTLTVDSLPKQPILISLFENPFEPWIVSKTKEIWPEYYRYNFDLSGNLIDSVAIEANVKYVLAIDTIEIIYASGVPSLWSDNHVYINNSYPVRPPTIGVATFDGLKSDGRPYVPNSIFSHGIADYLTSKPLNLEYFASDSIYFSFYYQPQGIGNNPETEDSLFLEFYSPDENKWYWQWSSQGKLLADFKGVIIPVRDTLFLKNGFRFRFANYATLSGNLDHWHLDYVRLDKNRTFDDLPQNDVSFVKPASILLKNYKEMPWRQYVANPTVEMFDSLTVHLRNNSTDNKVITYTYSISDSNGNELATNGGLNGSENPETDFTYANKINFSFPVSNNNFEIFKIVNIASIPVIGDQITTNDTLIHHQKFDHHFAYDDGSAEAAYGLNAVGAKMAYQFSLNTSDTLSAIAIHFAQVNQDVSFYPFKLVVWSSLNPENVVYQSSNLINPVYETQMDGYHVYQIDPLILPAGNFYVGLVQLNNIELNIGFDRNTNSKDKMFFNVSGSWSNTQYAGSWMIRPILGTPIFPVGINNTNMLLNKNNLFDGIKLFPNPSNGVIYIDGVERNADFKIAIIDIFGREMKSWNNIEENRFDLTDFSNGIYLVKFSDKITGYSKVIKIIINR